MMKRHIYNIYDEYIIDYIGPIILKDRLLMQTQTVSARYLFSGFSGFVNDELKLALQRYGIMGLGRYIFEGEEYKSLHVRYLHMEPCKSMTYDIKTYDIKADVMNIFDTKSKQCLVNKVLLHRNMKESNFLIHIENLFDFHYTRGIYIIRSWGAFAHDKYNTVIISNEEEFLVVKEYYSKVLENYSKQVVRTYRTLQVIISEYIERPLLFEGRKFQLALYLLIVAETDWTSYKCKIARHFGRILTANQPYVNGIYFDPEIHDTQSESRAVPKINDEPLEIPVIRSLFYPDRFPQQNMLPSINNQLDILESELAQVAKTLTPFSNQTKTAYEIFELDIMVLQDGSIKLLGINDKPRYWLNRDNIDAQNFIFTHSMWQCEEAIYPLLDVTVQS